MQKKNHCIMKIARIAAFAMFSAIWALTGCGPEIPGYKSKLMIDTEPVQNLVYDRYEEVLFGLDTADFAQELKSIQYRYRPFLDGDLENPEAIRYLKDFAIDPFSVCLYHKV